MGLLGKIFGEKNELPPLNPSIPGAEKLELHRSLVEPFIKRVNDKLEIIPVSDAVYVFIGKPPGMFGVVWFEKNDPKEHSFKTLMAEKGLQQVQIQLLSDRLRDVYVRHQQAPRYASTIAGKNVTITLDEGLANEVHNVIQVVLKTQ